MSKISEFATQIPGGLNATDRFEVARIGSTQELYATPENFRIYLAGRDFLTANRTYYVSSTSGNDTTGNGSVEAPWATWAKARDVLAAMDGRGFAATVRGAGTFTENIVIDKTFVGFSSITLEGDIATPGNCVIAPASGPAIKVDSVGTKINVSGLRLGGGAATEQCLNVGSGVLDITGLCEFNTVTNAFVIASGPLSELRLNSNLLIIGDCSIGLAAFDDSFIVRNTPTTYTITASGTRNSSNNWIVADRRAALLLVNLIWSGSFVGGRYSVGNLSLVTRVNVTGTPGNAGGGVGALGSYS